MCYIEFNCNDDQTYLITDCQTCLKEKCDKGSEDVSFALGFVDFEQIMHKYRFRVVFHRGTNE